MARKRKMYQYIVTKVNDLVVKLKKKNLHFKFVLSKIYTLNNSHEIKVEIGRLKTRIKVSVINVEIPLILRLDYQMV